MQTEDDKINKQILRYEMINYLHIHPKIRNELIDFGLIVLKLTHRKKRNIKSILCELRE